MEEKMMEMIRKVPKEHKDYPQKLKAYPDMPEALYIKGQLPKEEKSSVAIVGARACSTYEEYRHFNLQKP